ncbi:MAG TPA: sialate O-acetylesterase [Armatimonadota bacterium]|nr:sialate O-acetylesterase [Armatimonadota bacterium]
MRKSIEFMSCPQPYRVYQRSADNIASIDVSGELSKPINGILEARLYKKPAETLSRFDWQQIETDGRTFSGQLENVPVGGPYTLELRIRDNNTTRVIKRIPGLLVGDLWILAGQSNMEGCGKLINLEPPSKYVNALYFGDYWAIAKDPLCWFDEAVEPAHWVTPESEKRAEAAKRDRAFRDFGGGLGVRFGKEIYKATGIPVGLIQCAHGGTSLAQWSPKLKDKGGESLYGSLLRRVNLAGGKVTGCLWYQGEADAMDFGGKDYKELTKDLIENLRSDLSRPDLPFLYVQLSRFHTWDANSPRTAWNKVQNDQLLLEREMENVAFAASIDGTLSDPIHLDSLSQRKLGVRLAKLARKLVYNESNIELGPRPGKIEFIDNTRREIKIDYNCVNGSLMPARDIRGFLVEKDEQPIAITSCKRGSDGCSVIIKLAEPAPNGANLWYGRGLYPVVNLTDKAGFAAPVFGPVTLG